MKVFLTVTVTVSMTVLVHFGNFLALVGEFSQLTIEENISNLLIAPLLPIIWQLTFVFSVAFAMILALAQKMIENLDNVPKNDVEKWILDNLTLFKKLEPKFSMYCLIFISLM